MRFAAFRSQMMQKLNDLGAKAPKIGGPQFEREKKDLLRLLGQDGTRRRRKGASGKKRNRNRARISRLARRRHRHAA